MFTLQEVAQIAGACLAVGAVGGAFLAWILLHEDRGPWDDYR